MDSGMVVLLLVLGGVMVYMLFSPTSLIGPWLDRHCRKEKESWSGKDCCGAKDVEDTLIQSVNADIELPPKPKKKKPKKKRVYKRRKKK